jgi:transposase
LFEELKTLGYRGGYTEVKQFLHPWREGAATFIPPPPTARAVSWWVLTNVEALALDRQAFLEQLKSHDERVAHTIELAQQGWQVLRQRQSSKLKDWLSRALCCTAPELRSFARGLKRDYDAVRAALEHAETNRLAEGHVNRLKTHKRMMYGRANFDLLRAKVLYRG